MRFVCIFLLLFVSLTLQASERTVLVLGDSISAGYGIRLDQSWVSLLQQRLDAQGYPHRVVNASISGDTSAGARQRLGGILQEYRPAISIVELGGNDGLRGLSLDSMRENLGDIIRRLRDSGSEVLLIPMKLPPNYGKAFNQLFEQVYVDLAQQYQVQLGHFILDGVAQDAELMQDDGIHPVAAAQPLMLDNVWPDLRTLLGPAGTLAAPQPAL